MPTESLAELVRFAVGGVAQQAGDLQAGSRLIRAQAAALAEPCPPCWRDLRSVQVLQLGKIFQDGRELLAVKRLFLIRQVQAGEIGDMFHFFQCQAHRGDYNMRVLSASARYHSRVYQRRYSSRWRCQ